jgi:hypothetical protein
VKRYQLLQELDYPTLVKEYNEVKTTLDSIANESLLVSNSITQVEKLLVVYTGIGKVNQKVYRGLLALIL